MASNICVCILGGKVPVGNKKMKSALEQAMKAQMWSVGIAPLFLEPQHQMGWVDNAKAASPSRKRPGIPFTVGSLSPRVDLYGCGKGRPLLTFDPSTVGPVASCYTDSAIPGHP